MSDNNSQPAQSGANTPPTVHPLDDKKRPAYMGVIDALAPTLGFWLCGSLVGGQFVDKSENEAAVQKFTQQNPFPKTVELSPELVAEFNDLNKSARAQTRQLPMLQNKNFSDDDFRQIIESYYILQPRNLEQKTPPTNSREAQLAISIAKEQAAQQTSDLDVALKYHLTKSDVENIIAGYEKNMGALIQKQDSALAAAVKETEQRVNAWLQNRNAVSAANPVDYGPEQTGSTVGLALGLLISTMIIAIQVRSWRQRQQNAETQPSTPSI